MRKVSTETAHYKLSVLLHAAAQVTSVVNSVLEAERLSILLCTHI